ncbi:hypothetical protein N9E91_03075 [Alphaproteobacteria bacterium]|nr:hypothetical protein [Alphaproteobacteria bacterium]
MENRLAICLGFGMAMVLPPLLWLQSELIATNLNWIGVNPHWKYDSVVQFTGIESFAWISFIALGMSMLTTLMVCLIVFWAKISPLEFRVTKGVRDSICVASAILFLSDIASYFSIFFLFTLAFMSVRHGIARSLIGATAIFYLYLGEMITAKFVLMAIFTGFFVLSLQRNWKFSWVLALMLTSLMALHIGHRFYPSLNWLNPAQLNYILLITDIIPLMENRPNVAHYFICDIHLSACPNYLASIEIFLPMIFPVELRLFLSGILFGFTSLCLAMFGPKKYDAVLIALVSVGFFGLIYGNLTLATAAFAAIIVGKGDNSECA